MAQQIILTSDKKQVSVAPGAKTEFTVTIQNLTTLLDDVAVTLAGLDPAWVEVVPAHVPVFAQGEASVRVIIKPPLDPARAQAGIYPIQVNGQSQELSSQQATTRLELEIQFGGDYRIEVGGGTALSAQEATFPVKVRNDANAPLTLQCSGSDPQNVFWYKFDPFQINVAPGGETTAVLSIRSRQTALSSAQVIFSVSAQGEWTLSGQAAVAAPPHQVNGQWGQVEPTTLAIELRPYPLDNSGRARYQVVVTNPGGTTEPVTLEGSSADGLLGFQFDPPQVSLAPRSNSAANLWVWLAKATPAGLTAQALEFWVTARPLAPRTRPGSAKAHFAAAAAPKKRFNWIIPAVIAVLLFMLLCLAAVLWIYFNQAS